MSEDSSRPTVLVVDDDPGCVRAVGRILDYAGFATTACRTLDEARAALEGSLKACVITEFRLPDGQGVDFLSHARGLDEHMGRVMLTGVVDFLAVQEAVNQGSVHAFFTKPWDNDSLVQGVRSVLEQCRLARANAEMMVRLSDQNRALEATVRERTGQLEQAKRELEAVFDSWDDPVSIVDDRLRVVRANRAFAAQAGIEVTRVPGSVCHEILFGDETPCPDCPLARGDYGDGPREGVIRSKDRSWRLATRPLDLGRDGRAFLCRYRLVK
ncbi:MAG: response regulator [Deltaproteobacteria bacterium]|nr:response regulator [Deltaproteobacteria bacterium]